jgi:Ca2+-binding EF-hand superfamily protein
MEIKTTRSNMKSTSTISAIIGIAALLVASPALAAKKDGPRYKFFEKYDKNHNGVIDGDEKAAIRKDFAEKPDGDLKRFDKNKDGKLDDEEIAAIKPPTDKRKAEKGVSGKAASTNRVETAVSTAPKTNQTGQAEAPKPQTDKGAKDDKKVAP